jgi:hypothetical protein
MLRDIITGLAVWTIVAIELAGAIVLIRRQNRRRETEQKKRCGKVSINRKPINLQPMPPRRYPGRAIDDALLDPHRRRPLRARQHLLAASPGRGRSF